MLVDAHFVLFVVNINERQIQYLDNKLLLDKTYKERAFKLGVILVCSLHIIMILSTNIMSIEYDIMNVIPNIMNLICIIVN